MQVPPVRDLRQCELLDLLKVQIHGVVELDGAVAAEALDQARALADLKRKGIV